MASSGASWGIEIGANAIKAVKLEPGANGTVNVADFVIVPHKKVLSTPGIDQNDALRVGLGEFMSQVELAGATVGISVPGHSSFSRFAKLPPVEARNVPDIVKFEAVQQIPFPIDEVEWDYQTFADPNSPEIEVGIFAMTRERIMERLTQYQDVGLVPDFITLAPVANYNALAYDLQFTEKSEGTIILDIGTTSTDLVIANAGGVWIRTFPIGGHHFTEALVNAFQLSYPKAEKLKREAESSKHARHLFQAMRPVFGDLAQDVQRSIGYYQGLHKDAKLSRLVGVGSTFRLPGLRKYLRQQLGLDVYRLEQFKQVTMDGPRSGEFQSHTLNMNTAVGLALQGLGSSTLTVNLMPTSVIRESMWRNKVKWFGVAAGLGVAATAAMFYRPFVDSQAIAANPRTPIIGETIERLERQKREAAEVTATAEPNFAAANVLGLLDPRVQHIMPRVLDDLGQMLAFADGERAKRPGFDPAKAVGPTYDLRLFKPTQLVIRDAKGPDGEPLPPEELAKMLPELQIDARVVTAASATEARRFAVDTIDKWLRTNSKRADWPYEVLFETGKNTAIVRVTDEVVPAVPGIADAGPALPPPVAPANDGRGGRGGRAFGEGGGDPAGEAVASASVGGRVDLTKEVKIGEIGKLIGASQTEAKIYRQAETARRVAELLGAYAPLPVNQTFPPGTRISTIDVRYIVKLVPKADPAASEANSQPGGGS